MSNRTYTNTNMFSHAGCDANIFRHATCDAARIGARANYLNAARVSCEAFFSDAPSRFAAEANATRAYQAWRLLVDETARARHDLDMDKHIEDAITKLEALRDEQTAGGDMKRAEQTALEIERMEKNLVYR